MVITFCIPSGRDAALSLILAGASFWAAAQGPALARLYAAQPPEGSAYVRVVNPTAVPTKIMIGTAPMETVSTAGQLATRYRVIHASQPFSISVDGKPLNEKFRVSASSFVTFVLIRDSGKVTLKPLVDSTEGQNMLKADLRFYNFVAHCSATVAIADGPTVFDQVAEGDSRHRAINPVEAKLTARCDGAAATQIKLPPLKPGDHYSLFLTGDMNKVNLLGQTDLTETYDAAR